MPSGSSAFAGRGSLPKTRTSSGLSALNGCSLSQKVVALRDHYGLSAQEFSDDEIVAAMEAGLPREASAREQLDHLVRTHLRLFLIQGTGLCALVLSEGRSKGQELGESFLPLQKRYTAPLMELLARGQARGEICADMPLRLLRSLVLGPMEHILWEVVAQDRPVDLDAVAQDLVEMLWTALRAPETELAALRRLRDEVDQALRHSRTA